MNNIADDLLEAYNDGLKDGKPKWISMTEKLPPIEKEVLIYSNCISMIGIWRLFKVDDKLFFEDEEGLWQSGKIVTHWMPLPEPPEDGEI